MKYFKLAAELEVRNSSPETAAAVAYYCAFQNVIGKEEAAQEFDVGYSAVSSALSRLESERMPPIDARDFDGFPDVPQRYIEAGLEQIGNRAIEGPQSFEDIEESDLTAVSYGEWVDLGYFDGNEDLEYEGPSLRYMSRESSLTGKGADVALPVGSPVKTKIRGIAEIRNFESFFESTNDFLKQNSVSIL